MNNERRSFKRLSGPYDGGWDGASGRRECRITDLSRGGCFIDAYASNAVGARLTTEITLSGETYRLRSEVVYVDRVQGFAVRFLNDGDDDAAVVKALGDRIDSLAG